MWLQVCNIILGIWLLISPAILGLSPSVVRLDRIAGPVAIFIAVLALRDVTRGARVVNILTGLFLLIAVPVAQGVTTLDLVLNSVSGSLLIIFALPTGAVRQRVDGGWRAIVWPDPARYPDN
ncbi:MAG: SPW repeat domain-containing protein [Ktedonobacterales bacterium]